MRGVLRLTAAIALTATFRRGGVEFIGRAPVERDVRDLDGARLRQLINDPLITIEMADEDGDWHPMPDIDADATAGDLQLMIDAVASQLPPRDEIDMSGATQELFAIDADELALRDVGSVGDLLAQFDGMRAGREALLPFPIRSKS